MNRSHQTFLNAKTFLEQDVTTGARQLVVTARVRNDMVLRGVVLVVIDADDTVMSSFSPGRR